MSSWICTGPNDVKTHGGLVQWEVDSAYPTLQSSVFRMGVWTWQLHLTRGTGTFVEILPWKVPAENCVASLFIRIQSFPIDKQRPFVVDDYRGVCISGGVGWVFLHAPPPPRLIIEIKFTEMKLAATDYGGYETTILPSHLRRLRSEDSSNAARSDLSRMLREGILTDVTVNAGGGSIRAHRAVLAARSPVFMRMFTVDLKEKLLSTVDIADMSLEGCRAFIGYLYDSNTEEETLAHLDELLAASDKYDVKDLKAVCAACMEDDADSDKLLGRLQMAQLYQLPELKRACIRLLVEFKRMYEIPEDFDAFLKTADASLVDEIMESCKLARLDPPIVQNSDSCDP